MTIILPNAPKTLRVRFIGQYQSRPWVNVFHVQYSGAKPDIAAAKTLAQQFNGAWNTNLALLHTGTVQLNTVEVVDLDTSDGAVGTDNTLRSGTAALSGQAMPPNVACCLSWKIAQRYRGGHPRMYLTGQMTGNTGANGLWQGAWVTPASTQGGNFITGINGLTGPQSPLVAVATSYYKSHQGYPDNVRPIPQNFPIQSCVVHSRIDTQRRRLGKEVS